MNSTGRPRMPLPLFSLANSSHARLAWMPYCALLPDSAAGSPILIGFCAYARREEHGPAHRRRRASHHRRRQELPSPHGVLLGDLGAARLYPYGATGVGSERLDRSESRSACLDESYRPLGRAGLATQMNRSAALAERTGAFLEVDFLNRMVVCRRRSRPTDGVPSSRFPAPSTTTCPDGYARPVPRAIPHQRVELRSACHPRSYLRP
jgi:hypothetical protein